MNEVKRVAIETINEGKQGENKVIKTDYYKPTKKVWRDNDFNSGGRAVMFNPENPTELPEKIEIKNGEAIHNDIAPNTDSVSKKPHVIMEASDKKALSPGQVIKKWAKTNPSFPKTVGKSMDRKVA